MLDRVDSNRPERRSALVAHELSRLSIDIAALSEVRLAEEGNLHEHSAGYTLYWSGKSAAEKRLSGVGFMVVDSIASRLEHLPTGHSDRIISMRLPLHKQQYVTLFSVYAPTLQADEGEKDKFYTELQNLVRKTPVEDKVIILGDFNARVGQDFEAWKGALGKHGIGKCNDNGGRLLELCMEQQLIITNTVFQQKNRLKTTWMHPRSKHWHLIDYVIVRQRDLQDVLHTRVMPSAECHTDHRLVRCKLRLHFRTKPRSRGAPMKKLRVSGLQSPELKQRLQKSLQEKLETAPPPLDPCPETIWTQLKDIIRVTAAEIIGYTSRKNRDWFDENNEEIQKLLAKKRAAHQAHLAKPSCPSQKATFRQVCSQLQRRLRELQNNWWTALAEKTQLCADTGNIRGFYEALKAVYGPSHHIQSPLCSADGQTLLTDKSSILERWSEHFRTLFNADRPIDMSSILRIPQQPIKAELDLLPTIEEIKKATEQLKPCKAAGVDGLPPEIWKHGGPAILERLHSLLVCCWEQGTLPQDFRDAVIITLYKNKGVKSDCSNYRGITLLSIAGKILARILLNRLVPTIAQDNIPESQCGFRADRSTTDMVFVLRQLQEKCREQNKGLYITFVDLTKAFDTVSRQGMWLILERLGCPPKFLNTIIQLHEGQQGQVKLNSESSEPFPITNGVKQGCVLAPTLFSIYFSMVLNQAMGGLDNKDAVYIRYRPDGNLFDLRRLKARTKTTDRIIRDLLFADDAALVAHSESALQQITTCFAEAARLFGLEVSLKKTEVLHQPAPRETPRSPHIFIGEAELRSVTQFTYLGCIITPDAKIDREVDNRLAKASRAFGRLYKRVWSNKHLRKDTKSKVYRAVVLTTLLYGSESWVLYRRHLKLLERFHQRCLRTILEIKWSDHITNVEVLERSHLTSIETMILKSQLRWAGHVSRMKDHRLPRVALFGELSTGSRDQGGPKRRYKDTLKKALNSCNIDHKKWTSIAADRDAWRHTIHEAAATLELSHRNHLREKRQRRKDREGITVDPVQTHLCDRCGRTCLSRIGLYSHQRSCNGRGQHYHRRP